MDKCRLIISRWRLVGSIISGNKVSRKSFSLCWITAEIKPGQQQQQPEAIFYKAPSCHLPYNYYPISSVINSKAQGVSHAKPRKRKRKIPIVPSRPGWYYWRGNNHVLSCRYTLRSYVVDLLSPKFYDSRLYKDCLPSPFHTHRCFDHALYTPLCPSFATCPSPYVLGQRYNTSWTTILTTKEKNK